MKWIDRREFLAASGSLALVGSPLSQTRGMIPDDSHAGAAPARQTKRPNILWIQTDEQRPDSLGCYGSAWARTPNLDRLAQQGAVFHECHVQSPVCVPSRTSQLLCRYPQEARCYDNKYYYQDGIIDPQFVAFPALFANAGYRTASIGKWHTPNHPTWQEINDYQHFDNVGMWGLPDASLEKELKVIKRHGGTPIILAGIYPHAYWGATPSSQTSDYALRWLDQAAQADQPFFLRVSHLWPHTPVLPPDPWHKTYAADEIPCRLDAYEKTMAQRSRYDQALGRGQRGMELSESTWRWIRQCYYGLCAQVDHEIGRLLHRLDELAIAENTIVVYSSDHGKHLGEYGCCEKGGFDREVWRVPFIMAGPGVAPGQARHDLAEAIDLGPTLLNLCGLRPTDGMCGRNLFASNEPEAVYGIIERAGGTDPKKPYFPETQGFRRAAIRTRRYRYDINLTLPGGEPARNHNEYDPSLYDIPNDPAELNNLANDPAYQAVTEALHRKLTEWYQRYHRAPKYFG